MPVCGPEGEDERLFGVVIGYNVVALALLFSSISLQILEGLLIDVLAVSVDSIDVLLVVRYDAICDAFAGIETTVNLVIV
jgi:hypothetical protein